MGGLSFVLKQSSGCNRGATSRRLRDEDLEPDSDAEISFYVENLGPMSKIETAFSDCGGGAATPDFELHIEYSNGTRIYRGV